MPISVIFETHDIDRERSKHSIHPVPASLSEAAQQIGSLCGDRDTDGITLRVKGIDLTEENFHALVEQDCTIHVQQAVPEAAPGISGANGQIEVMRCGPYAQLTQRFDEGLCGGSSRMRAISRSIVAENLRDVKAKEDALRRSGEYAAADELQSCIRIIQDHSVPDILQVRDDVGKLGHLFMEIAGGDAGSRPLGSLQGELCKVLKRAEDVIDKNMDRFQKLLAQAASKTKSYNADRRWYSRCAAPTSCMGGTLCCASIGMGRLYCLSMRSARAVANVPCVGPILAATSVTKGWFGSATTGSALLPGAPCMLCTGSACCCAAAAGLLCAWSQCVPYKQRSQGLAGAMVDFRRSAELNREMWQGISLPCKQASTMLVELPLRNGPRHEMWREQMTRVGKMFLMTAQAVDVLIISLEQCGFTPKNYNVAALLGNDRYRTLVKQMGVTPAAS